MALHYEASSLPKRPIPPRHGSVASASVGRKVNPIWNSWMISFSTWRRSWSQGGCAISITLVMTSSTIGCMTCCSRVVSSPFARSTPTISLTIASHRWGIRKSPSVPSRHAIYLPSSLSMKLASKSYGATMRSLFLTLLLHIPISSLRSSTARSFATSSML